VGGQQATRFVGIGTARTLAALALGLLLLLGTEARSFAAIAFPADFNFDLSNSNDSVMSYTAASQTFTATAAMGTTARPAILDAGFPNPPFLAGDIVGNLSLTAQLAAIPPIGGSTGLLGGSSFTLWGTSATLGISDPSTILLAGKLLEFAPDVQGLSLFTAEITSIAPGLQSMIGDRSAAVVLNFVHGFVPQDFAGDFSGMHSASTSPDIYLIVPEPAASSLFAAGVAAFFLLVWRRRQRRAG